MFTTLAYVQANISKQLRFTVKIAPYIIIVTTRVDTISVNPNLLWPSNIQNKNFRHNFSKMYDCLYSAENYAIKIR